MREILFRGKLLDGTWSEGNLEIKTNGVFIITPDETVIGRYGRVIPETVGQYTGLTDKNGTKIFEGDILSIAQIMDAIGKYNFPPLKYPVNVVVIWDKCAWSWKTICKDKRYIHFPDAWCHFECEVIGNIHDNPELLKGGEG